MSEVPVVTFFFFFFFFFFLLSLLLLLFCFCFSFWSSFFFCLVEEDETCGELLLFFSAEMIVVFLRFSLLAAEGEVGGDNFLVRFDFVVEHSPRICRTVVLQRSLPFWGCWYDCFRCNKSFNFCRVRKQCRQTQWCNHLPSPSHAFKLRRWRSILYKMLWWYCLFKRSQVQWHGQRKEGDYLLQDERQVWNIVYRKRSHRRNLWKRM